MERNSETKFVGQSIFKPTKYFVQKIHITQWNKVHFGVGSTKTVKTKTHLITLFLGLFLIPIINTCSQAAEQLVTEIWSIENMQTQTN